MKFALVHGPKIDHAVAVLYAAAVQRQFREHVASMYKDVGADRVVVFAVQQDDSDFGDLALFDADAIPIFVHDGRPLSADVIHNAPDGKPIGHVWKALCEELDPVVDWRVIWDREALSIWGNPDLSACVEQPNGLIIDEEICTRVEGDVYQLDGQPLANFNTPACFVPPTAATLLTLYDYLGKSARPDQVRRGGWAARWLQGGWHVEGDMPPYTAAVHAAGQSRFARRAAAVEKARADYRAAHPEEFAPRDIERPKIRILSGGTMTAIGLPKGGPQPGRTPKPGWAELSHCGVTFCYYVEKLLTNEAQRQVDEIATEICNRVGNEHMTTPDSQSMQALAEATDADERVVAIKALPGSWMSQRDGTEIAFRCQGCGGRFVFAGGVPQLKIEEVA